MTNLRNSRHLSARGNLGKILLLLVGAVAVAGCRESRVRSYQVPAERVAPAVPEQMGQAATTEVEVPHWELPSGWQEVPGTGMRFATLVVEAGDPPLEIRVTPLNQAAGDLLENVNRWRGQIGLEPTTAMKVGSMVKSINAGGRPLDFINLTGPATSEGPAKQILAGILPGSQQIWFFLMMDNASRVSRHAAEVEAFLGTVHLGADPAMVDEHAGHDHAMGENHPDISTTQPGTSTSHVTASDGGSEETMTWTLPDGWTIDPTPRDMRVGTIRLPDAAGEVAITRFGGTAGDLLGNINRWRRQLNLPPVADVADQPSESMKLVGQPTRLFDISEEGSDGGRKRTMVVGLMSHGMTWFIKMSGPYDSLGQQEASFRRFLASVQLKEGGAS